MESTTPRKRPRRRLAALLAAGAVGGLAVTAVPTIDANATAAPGSGCAQVAIITAVRPPRRPARASPAHW